MNKMIRMVLRLICFYGIYGRGALLRLKGTLGCDNIASIV